MKAEIIAALISTAIRRFCLALIFVTPLLAVAFFPGRLNYYSAVVKNYECNRAVCSADFDGDAIPRKLSVESDARVPNFDS